jgi:phosphatidylinositol kinase/protein kinase (PI-3  family)
VKAGDDLRKEVLAMQLIEYCQHVFGMEGLDISLRPYQIVSTGQQSGDTHMAITLCSYYMALHQ